MLLKFQILFTILGALCLAAVLPVGTFFSWIWAMVCIFGAVMFYMLMRLCKQANALRANTDNQKDGEPAPTPDPAENKSEEQ